MSQPAEHICGERQDLVKMLRVLKILECHCLQSTVAVLELFDFSSFYNLRLEWKISEIFLVKIWRNNAGGKVTLSYFIIFFHNGLK